MKQSLGAINKNTSKEKCARFYERHPEKLTQKIICSDCGQAYLYPTKSMHCKTKRHILISAERHKIEQKKMNDM
jgi:uncharacterized OB-fold protein